MLGATFDTLPSPTNLKRWHITTEADCSLCSVKVCTTAHVLSGCKVALSQGRYTFRHDSILRVLHNSLSKFVSSMSPVKACLSLSSCFVKQGKRLCSSKKKPHVGILHESSDWKLSVDFDSSLVFPSFIAITSSRPDIVIYSVLKKTLNTKETKVVLSQLTSTAIQCSFIIWLNRDNKIWNEQATSTFDIPKKAPRKHTPFKNKVSKHSNAKYSRMKVVNIT